MFTIHKQTDYALLAVSHLAKYDKFVSLSELVEETNMPQRFLARITAKLVSKRILKSKEGRSGGYKLAKELKDINLLKFLRIFEKNIAVVNCNDKKKKCSCKEACMHRTFFNDKLNQNLENLLSKWTLEDVFLKSRN